MCPICLGLGFHMIKRFDASDRICPLCAGMGRVALPDTGVIGTCPRCEGRGLVRSQAAASAAAAGK
jgi:DnaJ-class molecular chaperone